MDLFTRLKRTFSRFGNVPDAEIKELVSLSKLKVLHKGESFVSAGEIPKEVGFVVSGSLRKFYGTEQGKEFIREFCVSGDFVAPYSSLLRKEASNVTIEAIEKSELIVAPWKAYEDLPKRHPGWKEIRLRLTEDLFIKREQKEVEYLLLTTRERYALFLKKYSQLADKIPQHSIASYLGITPVALSRLRRAR